MLSHNYRASFLSKKLPETEAYFDMLVTTYGDRGFAFLFFFLNHEEQLSNACFLCHTAGMKTKNLSLEEFNYM